MIALIIFLLCALAGASAFIMAASNAGRYSHENDQEYYSVSSAALLMVEIMDDLTYTSKEIKYDYERSWERLEDGSEHTTSEGYTLTMPAETGEMTMAHSTLRNETKFKLCETIKEQCDKLVRYLNVPDEWYLRVRGQEGAPTRPEKVDTVSFEFTITVQDNNKQNDERFGTVNCKLIMADNYNLLLTFDGGGGEYSITVYWVATVSADPKTNKPVYTYAESENGVYRTGSLKEEHTLNVVANWKKKNVTISRGEAITNEKNP